MVAVNISEFKAHLAEYLRQVRNGTELEILDRTTPVVRLVPIIKKTYTEITPAKKPGVGFRNLEPSKDIRFSGDVMDILMEERNRR